MRKATEIVAAVGAVLTGVGGVLLAIYLDDTKKFLDDVLSRFFDIPKSMVGYNVATVVIIVLLGVAVFSVLFFSTSWILNRFGPRKRPVQVPPVIQFLPGHTNPYYHAGVRD